MCCVEWEDIQVECIMEGDTNNSTQQKPNESGCLMFTVTLERKRASVNVRRCGYLNPTVDTTTMLEFDVTSDSSTS